MGRTRLAFLSDSETRQLPTSRTRSRPFTSDLRVQRCVVRRQRRLVALPVVGVVAERCFALDLVRLDVGKTAPATRPAGIRHTGALAIAVKAIPLLIWHRRVDWRRVARRCFL